MPCVFNLLIIMYTIKLVFKCTAYNKLLVLSSVDNKASSTPTGVSIN